MTTTDSGMFAWFSVFPPISKKQITELKKLEWFKLLKIRFKLSAYSWSPKALKNRLNKSVSHFITQPTLKYMIWAPRNYTFWKQTHVSTATFRQIHKLFFQHSCIRGFSKFKMQWKANTKKKNVLSTHKLGTACDKFIGGNRTLAKNCKAKQ